MIMIHHDQKQQQRNNQKQRWLCNVAGHLTLPFPLKLPPETSSREPGRYLVELAGVAADAHLMFPPAWSLSQHKQHNTVTTQHGHKQWNQMGQGPKFLLTVTSKLTNVTLNQQMKKSHVWHRSKEKKKKEEAINIPFSNFVGGVKNTNINKYERRDDTIQ